MTYQQKKVTAQFRMAKGRAMQKNLNDKVAGLKPSCKIDFSYTGPLFITPDMVAKFNYYMSGVGSSSKRIILATGRATGKTALINGAKATWSAIDEAKHLNETLKNKK